MKRYLILVLIVSIFIIAFSCEGGTSTFEVNCSECFINEPDSFELEVELSINSVYDTVYLEFFKGNVESGELIWDGDVDTPLFYLLVPINEFYSVRATYKEAEKSIFAIDGDKMFKRYIADACDNDCWIVKGGFLDVRLKYE